MMGVYGMLAIGLALFCLRYLIPDERWPEKWARLSFWSTNIGLAWMCFATLLPLGILQLYESVNKGYFEARELKFLTNDTNALIEWMRLPGDIIFIAGGALPTLYIAYLGVRHTVKRVTLEEPEDILFTEIVEPEGVPRDGRRRGRCREADVSPEILLFSGYAAFLLVAAGLLECALRAHAPAIPALSDGGLRVRPGSRSLDVPRGPAAVAARVRSRATTGSLSRQGPHLQRLPTQGGLHRLVERARGRPATRSVAALGGRTLPQRAVARAGGAFAADADRRRRAQP